MAYNAKQREASVKNEQQCFDPVESYKFTLMTEVVCIRMKTHTYFFLALFLSVFFYRTEPCLVPSKILIKHIFF